MTVEKNLNRWFKEKWVDVSRKKKDGTHPPCGRSKAKTSSKGYPKCRPSVKVSSKTPKTSGSMSEGQKRAATKRKRAKKQGVGGKPTIVKIDVQMTAPEGHEGRLGHYDSRYPVPEERDEGRVYLDQIASESNTNGDEKRLQDMLNYALTHESIHREIDPELYQWLMPRRNQMTREQMIQGAEYPAIQAGMAGLPRDTQQFIQQRAKRKGVLKAMDEAWVFMKGGRGDYPPCPTPNKGKYQTAQEAQQVAEYQSRVSGRPISTYPCPCGFHHLTRG